jgi:hypothetical protein
MFVRSTKFKAEFDGQTVEATLAPLTLEALLSIQGATTKEDAVRRIAETLPAVVTFSVPPIDADGLPVPVEEVCRQAYFAALVGDMGAALIAAAKPANPNTPAVASDGSRRANDSAPISSAASAA